MNLCFPDKHILVMQILIVLSHTQKAEIMWFLYTTIKVYSGRRSARLLGVRSVWFWLWRRLALCLLATVEVAGQRTPLWIIFVSFCKTLINIILPIGEPDHKMLEELPRWLLGWCSDDAVDTGDLKDTVEREIYESCRAVRQKCFSLHCPCSATQWCVALSETHVWLMLNRELCENPIWLFVLPLRARSPEIYTLRVLRTAKGRVIQS